MISRPVFLIGTARAGTTSLADQIASGLGLDLARGKETHFLASRGIPSISNGPSGAIFDKARVTSFQDFMARFPKAPNTGVLDASTSSLYYSRSTAETLSDYFPDARLIVVLRNPIDRAISAYRYMRARGFENLPWPEALAAEERRIRDAWPHIWHYRSEGSYAWQLAGLGRWREKTLFLLYERDLADPGLLARISAHTGYRISNDVPLGNRNGAQQFRSPRIGRAIESVRVSKVADAMPAAAQRAASWMVDRLRSSADSSPDDIDRSSLADLLASEADAAAQLTGLDCVSAWRK